MRYLLLFPLAILILANTDNKESGQNPPGTCKIANVIFNKRIGPDSAVAEFHFRDNQGLLKNSNVVMSYNDFRDTLVSDSLGIASLKMKAGKYKFQFYIDEYHHEIYSDSIFIRGGHRTAINVAFRPALNLIEADKPVIYVYSEIKQHVNITLDVQGQMMFSYPKYINGWNFTANADGAIDMNGKTFDYLFWDAEVNLNRSTINIFSGFLVRKDSLTSFFESKLTQMGLTAREQQDFITYWVPRMQENEISFVQFLFNDEYDAIAGINVTPKPDHIFRVFMLWSDAGLRTDEMITEQKIEKADRGGLSVIEWGGAGLSSQAAVSSRQ